MALPTVVGVGAESGSAGDATPGLPAGITSGDDLWLAVESNSNQNPSAPSGYVEVAAYGRTAGAGSTQLTIFHKKAGASESAPTIIDTGNHTYARIIATRGSHATTPVEDEDGGSEENTDTSLSIPGLTTGGADRLILLIAATALDTDTPAWSDWTNGDLANLTEQAEGGTSAGSGGGIVFVTGEKASAGTFGATTATAPADHKAYIVIAIQPPAGGGTAHEVDVNDSVSVADNITVSRGIVVAINDSASLADDLGREAEFFRTVDDTAALQDVLTRAAEYFRSVDDSVGLADAIQAGLVFARDVDDLVALADDILKVLGYGRAINDSVALADNIDVDWTPGGPVNWTRAINDSVVVTDVISVAGSNAQLEKLMQMMWRYTRRRDSRRHFGL